MLKRTLYVCALVAGLAGLASTSARAVTVVVDAKANSSTDGTAAIGGNLTFGQGFTVTVAEDDLWNAGPLPRWSNAAGLTGNLFATGADESGENPGTLIGENFAGGYTQDGFNAPYGSLVGRVGLGAYFLIGTSYSGTADASGQLSLYYWDSNNYDNSDFITASINAAAVPGPIVGAGLPGFLMALGGLVIFARRRRGRAAA